MEFITDEGLIEETLVKPLFDESVELTKISWLPDIQRRKIIND